MPYTEDEGEAEDIDDRDDPLESDMDDDDDPEVVACPFCGAALIEDAEICPKCGNYTGGEDAPRAGKPIWLIVIVLLVALTFAISVKWLFRL